MLDENSEDFAKLQTEQLEDASADATSVILAEVLRVFAARGRAIREERAKQEATQLGTEGVANNLEKQECSLNQVETVNNQQAEAEVLTGAES